MLFIDRTVQKYGYLSVGGVGVANTLRGLMIRGHLFPDRALLRWWW